MNAIRYDSNYVTVTFSAKEYVAFQEWLQTQVWPQKDDVYYAIDASGRINTYRYYDDSTDEKRKNFNNMFKTREEAEFRVEQLKVERELAELADGDLCDGNKPYYFLVYNVCDRKISTIKNYSFRPHRFCFESPESAQAAIDQIGVDRLKKYFFEVKKDQ